MFLMQTSEVYALGRGDWGLLGMGDRMDRKAPCKITELQALRPSALHNPNKTTSGFCFLMLRHRTSASHSSRAAFATGFVLTELHMRLPAAPLTLSSDLVLSAAVSFDGQLYVAPISCFVL